MASKPRVLIDTGPLVAFLSTEEAVHEWVVAQFAGLLTPFATCEPVLAETFFLLSRHPEGPRRYFELLASGLLVIDFSLLAEQQNLATLIRKYRELPMSLADACLVRMAELNPEASVFTLDSHFLIYRKNGRQAIPLIIP